MDDEGNLADSSPVPDLDADAIATAATGPAEAAVDGQSARAHSIPDQIKADEYQRSDDMLTRPGGGWGGGAVKIAKARGSGAVQ